MQTTKAECLEKTFVVVGRVRASVVFPPGEHIQLTARFGDRAAEFIIATRFITQGPHTLEAGLMVQITGNADNIQEAVSFFANKANVLLKILALATNAWVDDIRCELAYEITEGVKQRQYFQVLIPNVSVFGPQPRLINASAVVALIEAISAHSELDRLARAATHYADMLSHWYLDDRLRCVTHTFLVVEALGPVALRHELKCKSKT